MFSKVLSGALLGIDGAIVEVEVHLTGKKLPRFITVGLPEGAVKESKERVQAAIRNSGFDFPNKHITVNLAPADLRKEGTAYDLPIAIGILSALGSIDSNILKSSMILGELSLNGWLRKVKGVLSFVIAARDAGLQWVILPYENLYEANVVTGVTAIGVKSLTQVVNILNEPENAINMNHTKKPVTTPRLDDGLDFSDVKGQVPARRALEISAAGGHNILMVGPPGSGKTMIAKRLPGILPDMSIEESLETTKIYSVSGLIPNCSGLIRQRPFRAPHHTISDVGLIGGGHVPRPGEVSLSHNGVLFLDEFPEFRKNVLEVLRQPIEDGCVNVSRAMVSVCFPSKFMLVAAMNPCPCGFSTDPSHECTCSMFQIQKYMSRLSGPLLDRMDIHIEVPSVPFNELSGSKNGEASSSMRKRVEDAVKIQLERFSCSKGIYRNTQMNSSQIREFCKLDNKTTILLEKAIEKLGLSARAYDRILKVSRTIADIEKSELITSIHITEAVHYRSMDRKFWN